MPAPYIHAAGGNEAMPPPPAAAAIGAVGRLRAIAAATGDLAAGVAGDRGAAAGPACPVTGRAPTAGEPSAGDGTAAFVRSRAEVGFELGGAGRRDKSTVR
jgi:hypothetical protein